MKFLKLFPPASRHSGLLSILLATSLIGVTSASAWDFSLSLNQDKKGSVTAGKASVEGLWQGKWPDKSPNMDTDLAGLPAIDLDVKVVDGKITGSVVFYAVMKQGDASQIDGKDEVQMIDLKFDGTTLAFTTRQRNEATNEETTTRMALKITGTDEGELRVVENDAAPVLRMLKKKQKA